MPVLIDTDSEEAKERRKWEMDSSMYGPPGRPRAKIANSAEGRWPVMLYRARRIPGGVNLPNQGKLSVGVERPPRYLFINDDAFAHANVAADHFARENQAIANDETEYKRLKAQGWCDSSEAALAAAEAEEHRIAELAANRAYGERNMSEAAKAEAEKFEKNNFGHQPVIPEQRVKRAYNRKPKPEQPPAA